MATIYIKAWRALVVSVLVGSALAIGIVLFQGRWYTATASFVPESGSETDLSSLAGLAGQFGVPLGGGRSGPSPDLYAALAASAVILRPIVLDTFRIAPGVAPQRLADLLRPKVRAAERRVERATDDLKKATRADFNRRTGLVALSVRTRWRAVSISVAERILAHLNDFNLRTRQSRGKAEREFAEARATEARSRLRGAEEAERRFSTENRSITGSPTLMLEYQRLAREVSLRQQLAISIEESLEKARLREIQDTPVITILQAPSALSVPDARGLIKYTSLGAIAGLFFASVTVLIVALTRHERATNAPEAEQFFAVLATARRNILVPFRSVLRSGTKS